MAAAFIFFPLGMLLGAAVFVTARLRRASREHSDFKKEWALSRAAVRDPVTGGVLLILSGVIGVSFISGRVRLDDYSDLISDAVDAYRRAVTEWTDPLSSESISFKGGILIVFVSAVIVAYSLVGHFRSRWKAADKIMAAERLG